MIESVRIQGFKSIVSAELDLGRLNVLVGANGSGKSNVLEALGLLGCAVSGRVGEEAFRFRGIRPGAPALFKTAYHGERIPRLIRLSAAARDQEYRVSLDNPTRAPEALWCFANENLMDEGWKIASRGPPGATFFTAEGSRDRDIHPARDQGIVPFVRTIRRDSPARGLLSALESYAIYTPFTPMLRGLAADPAPRDPVGLSGGGLADALRDLLVRHRDAGETLRDRVLDLVDWAHNVDTTMGGGGRQIRFRDRWMRAGRDTLSAADASEGALYVLFLFMLLYHPLAPSFAAVDNIDSALHPRLARALVERVQDLLITGSLDRQLVVTTHNPLVLDALRLDDPAVRLLVVSRQKGTGFTTLRRIEHTEALDRARQRGRTLSQLWIEGTLGGVPDLM
jgi:predicted ATPase